MKKFLPFLLLGALAGLLSALPAEPAPADLASIISKLKDAPIDDVIKQAITQDLKDPDVLNQILGSLRAKPEGAAGNLSGLAGVLSTLNVRFKAFQTKGSTSSSLGLEYSFERSLKNHELDGSVGYPLSLSFSVHAKGNIAFDQKLNPDDFLDTGASFDVFGSRGGFEPVVNAQDWADHMQDLITTAAKFTGTPAELDASPVWREIESTVGARLSTQYFWRASGNFSLESNQDFTKKQYAYGLLMSGVIRAWNPQSAWAEFNVFDWPFAALRYLTGADAKFSPSGRAIPLVLFGLEQVDPAKNPGRLAVDPGTSSYSRLRGEISMKTKVARISTNDLWFFASYRRYAELSAPAAVRAAQLDRFAYWALGLELENGLSVTYSKGKLPLDRKSDQVFDIGYKLNLK